MTEKKKRGRPSLYRPEYCLAVIEMGSEGYSIAQMAARIGVDKASIHDWKALHPEFAAALARATTMSQAWWEDRGRVGLTDKGFNAALWMKMVGSMFRDDYSERKEITGANGGPIQLQAITLPIDQMDDEEVEQVEAVLTAALERAKGSPE